jgi:iron complex outermembrane receptor protein
MNLAHKTKIAMGVSLAIAAASNVTTVSAQGGLVLEEVIVSARKRDESLQDVPLSIRAISAQEISRLGVSTTEDIVALSPGLTINKGIGGNDIRPDIRGLTQLSGRSNVAILVDGVDQTTDALTGTGAGQLVSMGLFDLERVEVVKGPQSAVFGRNAFGGAISYITKRPSDELDARIDVEGAEHDTFKAKFGISGPITDELLYRFNIAYEDVGGQFDHPITGETLGGSETDAVSLALQWLPNDNMSNLFRYDHSEQERQQNPIAVVPYNTCRTQSGAGATSTITETDGACTLDPANNQDSVFRGSIPELSESDIQLSAAGVEGTTNDVDQFTNLFEWEVSENYSLVSNTAYIKHHGEDEFDLDQQGDLTSTVPGSTASFAFSWADTTNPLNYRADAEFDREVIFQDLRFSYDGDGSIRWMAGLEYYEEDYDQKNYNRANASVDRNDSSPTATGNAVFNVYSDITGSGAPTEFGTTVGTVTGTLPGSEQRTTEVTSVYGSIDWEFAESWELSLSARYQEDKIDIKYDAIDHGYLVPAYEDQKPGAIFNGSIPNPLPPFLPPCTGFSGQSPSGNLCAVFSSPGAASTNPRVVEADEVFTAFNPRASLTWNVSDTAMLYTSVAQGTKPGGFNFDPTLLDQNIAYDQEELTAYEFGWKTTWREGRAKFNGTIFLNDNTDKQTNDIQYSAGGTPLSFVSNIGEVESSGIELKYATYLTEGLLLDINYVYTKTDIKKIDIATNPDGTPGLDLEGEELPWTPNHAAVVTLQYDWDLSQDVGMFVRLDTRYMSERYADLEGNAEFDAKSVSDIKIGLVSERYEVIGFVDNVLDDDTPENGVAFVNFFENFQDMFVTYLPEERTMGVRMSYKF